MPQPRFCQIDVALDAAQDFITDHVLVAKFNNRLPLNLKRFVRQTFVFRRKEAERSAGTFGFGAFHLADMVFVFDAQSFQRVGFGRVAFCDFIELVLS